MTATTIKVSLQLRDELKAQAFIHGRTLGEHLQVLLAEEARRERFRELRRRMAESPPDGDYLADTQLWQSDAWT